MLFRPGGHGGNRTPAVRGARRPNVFLCVLLLLAFATNVFAAEQRDYAPVQVAPHTWVIHGPLGDPSPENQGFMNNPAFVLTNDGVVVIDPGSSVQAGRMVLRQIRKLTDKPVTHVLDTHMHGDHWLGNQAIRNAYPQALLMAHPKTIEAARGITGRRWVDLMTRLTGGFTSETQPVPPTVALAEQTLSIGGLSFRLHAPERAHSGTDVMIEVVEDGVLFTGDNVMNGRIGRMDDGSFAGGIAACDRALDTPARVFVPGHGASGGRDIVAAYRGFLATLLETVTREYDAGRQDYEMKPAVRARLAPYAGWVGFDDNLGRQISQAVLEIEAM